MRSSIDSGRSLKLGGIAFLFVAVMPVAGRAPAYQAPRTADGKPNLNGIWQVLDTSINWDIQGHAAKAGPVSALGAAFQSPRG